MPAEPPPELVAPVHTGYPLDGVVLAAVANGTPVYIGTGTAPSWTTATGTQAWKITLETSTIASGGTVETSGDFFRSADGRRWGLVAVQLGDGSHWAVAVPAPT